MDAVKAFVKKYIVSFVRSETKGYVYMLSMYINSGAAVWASKDRKEYLVVRYPILLCIGLAVSSCVLADHVLNIGNTNWFNKILEYNYCAGSVIFVFTLNLKQREVGKFSELLDLWWSYSFLEEEQDKLKESLQKKLNKFNGYYYKFMLGGVTGYSLMPFGRYLYDADKSSVKLLLFQCWSPLPIKVWWGFALTFLAELVTMSSLYFAWTFIVSYLITVMETIGSQLRLVGLSLVTVEARVLKSMAKLKVQLEEDALREQMYVALLQKELRNSARHYQKLYRLAKEACKLFAVPINICYYSGMFAMVISCAKLATERNNKFVLFQALMMFLTVLVNQYIVSWINQILTDQAEVLRETVYDSPWYGMPISCRRTINMIQGMVKDPPSIKTVMGAKTDMEFFASVVNASYFYLGALLSINKEY